VEPDEYLKSVLDSQTLNDDSEEMSSLRAKRDEIESLLRKEFEGSSPTIRYGGSKAKNTLIKESYDLDLACYFPHDDTKAGESLKDVYYNVKGVLGKKYTIREKTSSLRILGEGEVDFHVDVVPGRFTDDKKSDSFLHQTSGGKDRLKTNLDVHIEHVRDSGLTEPVRLNKLWRTRYSIGVRTFPLELLIVKLLSNRKSHGLSRQLEYVWTEFRDRVDELSIEDPANPTGNDLSDLLNKEVRSELRDVAKSTLNTIKNAGWEAVFGSVEHGPKEDKRDTLKRAAELVPAQTKPWCASA
jgi:hypothetical protein